MALEKDILLDENNDLAIVDYDLALTSESQITTQRIKQRLLTFQGEWFLNNDLGLPYFTEILGKNKSLPRIEAIYIRSIQEIEEVAEILALAAMQDAQSRTLTVNFSVRDIYNNIIEDSINNG